MRIMILNEITIRSDNTNGPIVYKKDQVVDVYLKTCLGFTAFW